MKLDLLWHMLSFQHWKLLQAANPTGHVPAGSPSQQHRGQGDNRQLSAASRFQQGSGGQGAHQQHPSGSPSQRSRAGQGTGRQPPQRGGNNHLRRTAAAPQLARAAAHSPVMQQRQQYVRRLTGPTGEEDVRHSDTMFVLASAMHPAMSVTCCVTPQM